MDPNLDVFLDQQRARGAFDTSGRFSIDYKKARPKLAQYRLDDPHAYLLVLVQLGVLLECAEIGFIFAKKRVRVSFWSPKRELRTAQLIRLLEEPLAADRDPLNSVLALCLNSSPAKNFVFQDSVHEFQLSVGNGIHESAYTVEGRPHYRFIFERDDTAKARIGEAGILHERACFSPIPILADQHRVSARPFYARISEKWGIYKVVLAQFNQASEGLGFTASGFPSVCSSQGKRRLTRWWANPDEREYVFVSEGPEDKLGSTLLLTLDDNPGQVHLLRFGVVVETRDWPVSAPGVVGLVQMDDFETDLSGLKLRNPEAVEARLRNILKSLEPGLTRLESELDSLALFYREYEHTASAAVVGGALGLLLVVGSPWVLFGGLAGALMGPRFGKLGARVSRGAPLEENLKAQVLQRIEQLRECLDTLSRLTGVAGDELFPHR